MTDVHNEPADLPVDLPASRTTGADLRGVNPGYPDNRCRLGAVASSMPSGVPLSAVLPGAGDEASGQPQETISTRRASLSPMSSRRPESNLPSSARFRLLRRFCRRDKSKSRHKRLRRG